MILLQRFPSIVFTLLTLLFALVGAFAKTMIYEDHNEHMYISAAIHIANSLNIYCDFPYLQTPYLPLLYAYVYKFFGVTEYYYLIAKLISFTFLCISSLAIFALSYQVSKDRFISFGLAALLLLNSSLVVPATEVSNYILPVALSLSAFTMFHISISKREIAGTIHFFIGLLLALSVGTKLTYAPIILPFLLIYYAGIKNTSNMVQIERKPSHLVYYFLCGLVVGFLPLLALIKNMEIFVFNNVGYHMLNTEWRKETGFTARMSLQSKYSYAKEILFNPENRALFCAIFLCATAGVYQAIRDRNPRINTSFLLASVLLIVAVLVTLIPTPTFHQHYALPISFIFPLLALQFTWKNTNTLYLKRLIISMLLILTLFYNAPTLVEEINMLHKKRSNWSGLRVHDDAYKIRKSLEYTGMQVSGKVATLSPLFAIEANLKTYTELSPGPFFYRVSNFLSPDQLKRYRGTSSNHVKTLLDKHPPIAIFVGKEGGLDRRFIKYAQSRNYTKAPITFSQKKMQLFIRSSVE